MRCPLRHENGKPSRTYKSWQAMRERCFRPTSISFKNYGAKGVTICKRWDSFDAFFEDMGRRPDGTSLDRKNNKLGYSKDNCQWSTRIIQARNRNICRAVKFRGQVKNLAEWCIELNIPYPRTYYRIVIKRQPVEVAFNPNTTRKYK